MRSIESTGMAASARGDVVLSLYRDGRRVPFVARHNTLSYSAADAVAAAYGGDLSLVPRYVGFVYGSDAEPADLATVSDRSMRWPDIRDEMTKIVGNVLVSRFISSPEISVNDPASSTDEAVGYLGNSVTFRACTRSGSAGTYAFDTTPGNGFAGEFKDGMYLYHALLLGDVGCQRCQDEKDYTVLGRVSLAKGGSFRMKPSDYELALDWKVSFF